MAGNFNVFAMRIAVFWIFGLKSLEQIDSAFNGKLYDTLTKHFTRDMIGGD